MLPEDVQQNAVAEYQGKRGPVTLEDVRRWKQEAEHPIPKPPTKNAYVRTEATRTHAELPPGAVTVVMADETGPAPTPEQMEELLERTKERRTSGAVVLPEKLEDEAGAPLVQWGKWARQADAENTGKIVDSPALPSPPPAEDVPKPGKEPLSKRQAANILEDLQMYCEEMLAIESERAETWAERADALAVAIAALRK